MLRGTRWLVRSLGEGSSILWPPGDCSLLVPEAVMKSKINVMYKVK